MEDFKVIVITSPNPVKDEAEKISRLLNAGVDFVHIRKPEWTLRDVINLVEDIPFSLRKRLKLHGHFQLLDSMTLGGVHLNRRNPHAPSAALSVSKSCHSLKELQNLPDELYDYVTLSPIFDSISKEGYPAAFDLAEIVPHIRGKRVFALGGVTPEHFLMLREKEFAGAALLGYIWNQDFEVALRNIEACIKSVIKTHD